MTYAYDADPALSETLSDELEPPRQTLDVPLSPAANAALLVAWVVICLIGLAVGKWLGSPRLGGVIIAVPTFAGMVIKPSFALCMVMLILPTGSMGVTEHAVEAKAAFTLDRSVGIAMAASFALNLIIVSHARLRLRERTLWIMAALTLWITLAILWSPAPEIELQGFKTHTQILIMSLIIYWILEASDHGTFFWALRSYVIGCAMVIGYTLVTGKVAAMESAVGGRASAMISGTEDPNYWSSRTSLAFISAAYLMARDRNKAFRLFYMACMLIFPIMLLRAASRGAIIALTAALLVPVMSPRHLIRKPFHAVLMILLLVIAVGAGAYFVKTRGFSGGRASRLTSERKIATAFYGRLNACYVAMKVAIKWPLGTTRAGWTARSGMVAIPHADLFYLIGLYGFLGGALFAAILASVALRLRRLPVGLERLFAIAAFTFIVIMSLDIRQLPHKHIWAFMIIILTTPRIARLYEEQPWFGEKIVDKTTGYGYY